ncbi:MAG: LPS export ABC transporter permease LptF [Sinobacteraceae bacterium]|nr:LPS export ABC transporter permease LptF [Nevskiaceae bacterium]
MIINRYLMYEISQPLLVVLGVLVVLFAGYGAAGFLSDAVNGLLPSGIMVQLIGLKVLISLEVLIPISLYISVVLALGRLHSESEILAMFALRISPMRVMGAVVSLAVVLALIVAALSLLIRPWAYQKSHELSNQAAASFNFDNMQAGTFYENSANNRVIFIGKRDGSKAPAEDVFVQLRLEGTIQTVHARKAVQQKNTGSGSDLGIRLEDAHIYQIAGMSAQDDRIIKARAMILDLGSPDVDPPGYSSLAASSTKLATSNSAADIAELQWRLSTPLSTLLLGMLGVPLSRARPRQGKYAKMGTAILIYVGYYLLCTSARNWVKSGAVAAFPGIWWAPALLLLVLIFALFWPGRGFRR